MKTNRELGFVRIARVGSYEVGLKGKTYRAHGYEWKGDQSSENEGSHHEVCGRGATTAEAIDRMIDAAIIAGRTPAGAHGARDWWVKCDGLTRNEAETLRRELKEAVAEIEDVAVAE